MYYECIPKRVINYKGTTTVWDVPVFIDRTLLENRPGVVMNDKTEKTCLLTDVAISDDSKGNRKETEKLRKYKDLEIEVSRMWKLKTKLCRL